jgi:hypothetical protein
MFFGVVEWFFPVVNFAPRLARAFGGLLEYIVWLAPAIVIAFLEAKRLSNIMTVCLQTAFFLLVAVFGYYSGYAYNVFIIGQSTDPSSLIVERFDNSWAIWLFFVNSIFPEMVEWGSIAIVTGICIGIAVYISNTIPDSRH